MRGQVMARESMMQRLEEAALAFSQPAPHLMGHVAAFRPGPDAERPLGLQSQSLPGTSDSVRLTAHLERAATLLRMPTRGALHRHESYHATQRSLGCAWRL